MTSVLPDFYLRAPVSSLVITKSVEQSMGLSHLIAPMAIQQFEGLTTSFLGVEI